MKMFKDLAIGDRFDFVNDKNRMMNSFYDRCVKISQRKYQSIDTEQTYQVGTIACAVYHVNERRYRTA